MGQEACKCTLGTSALRTLRVIGRALVMLREFRIGNQLFSVLITVSIIEDAHGAMHRRPLDFLGRLVEVGITN